VMRYKRPGYIEIPRDMVTAPVSGSRSAQKQPDPSPPKVLREALDEASAFINAAQKPVILAGVEMMRFGLQEELVRFIEKTQIPAASTILAKSVIGEKHPLYMGIYEGVMGA
jgi:TPP-dependent 2-oxoacid decarboxylase